MEKERFFSKKTLFFMFVSLAVVFCSLFTIKPANVYAENVNVSNSIQNSVYSSNTLTNNIVFIKFKGEEETYSLYGNSFDLFNEMFNDGEFSVENYYKANSNGKFDLKSDIISSERVDRTSESHITHLGCLNAPTRFFPQGRSIAVLPPTEESICAKRVVGIWM